MAASDRGLIAKTAPPRNACRGPRRGRIGPAPGALRVEGASGAGLPVRGADGVADRGSPPGAGPAPGRRSGARHSDGRVAGGFGSRSARSDPPGGAAPGPPEYLGQEEDGPWPGSDRAGGRWIGFGRSPRWRGGGGGLRRGQARRWNRLEGAADARASRPRPGASPAVESARPGQRVAGAPHAPVRARPVIARVPRPRRDAPQGLPSRAACESLRRDGRRREDSCAMAGSIGSSPPAGQP